MMWDAIFILIISMLFLVGCIFSFREFRRSTEEPELVYNPDMLKRYTSILNQECPTDVILYGEPVCFDGNLSHRYEDKLSRDVFDTEKDTQFLIVNDFQGVTAISDDEWNLIKERVEDGHTNFYYLGEKAVPKLKELNVIDSKNWELSLLEVEHQIQKSTGKNVWVIQGPERFQKRPEVLGNVLIRHMGFFVAAKEHIEV